MKVIIVKEVMTCDVLPVRIFCICVSFWLCVGFLLPKSDLFLWTMHGKHPGLLVDYVYFEFKTIKQLIVNNSVRIVISDI